MQSALRILLVFAGSALIGAVWAGVKGVPWTPDAAAVVQRLVNQKANAARIEETPDVDHGVLAALAISLDELREYMDSGAVIIDARDRASFEAGHLFVDREPPVINVPPEDSYEQHLDRLYSLQGYRFVLYCNSSDCHLAEDLYRVMSVAGITESSEVRVYFPGWAELEKTDLPKADGPDNWPGFGLPMTDDPPDAGDVDEVAAGDDGTEP